MRITAGQFGGIILNTPKDNAIRPSTDKVRQAIFNSLKSKIDITNITVLDGTSGTGAMGLEALSRGANFCHFVDQDRKATALIKNNIEKCKIDIARTCITQSDLRQFKSYQKFDLIFLDPPYNKNLLRPMTDHIMACEMAHSDTVFVLEEDKHADIDLELNIIDEKAYGRVRIIYAKKPA